MSDIANAGGQIRSEYPTPKNRRIPPTPPPVWESQYHYVVLLAVLELRITESEMTQPLLNH
jgi:hypothetical protein